MYSILITFGWVDSYASFQSVIIRVNAVTVFLMSAEFKGVQTNIIVEDWNWQHITHFFVNVALTVAVTWCARECLLYIWTTGMALAENILAWKYHFLVTFFTLLVISFATTITFTEKLTDVRICKSTHTFCVCALTYGAQLNHRQGV